MRDQTGMALARDAHEAGKAMLRYLDELIEALNPETLTAEQGQEILRWLAQWRHEPDFRRGIPLAYKHIEHLAILLDDDDLLRHLAWSMDAIARWLQFIYDKQRADRS